MVEGWLDTAPAARLAALFPDSLWRRPLLLWAACLGIPLAWLVAEYSLGGRKRGANAREPTDFSGFLIDKSVKGGGGSASTARQGPKSDKQRRKESSDFNTFLKVVPPPRKTQRDPTDFSSFLKDGGESSLANGHEQAEEQQAAAAAGPSPEDVVVTVLFGTEYGFSKEIADKLCDQLRAAGSFWPRLLDMADYPSGLEVANQQALLVVCSTQGDGVPPTDAREFCDWLASEAAPQLTGVPFSVCALGDRSYIHFCACGRAIDARLEGLGGTRLAPRADVNREDWPAVDAWLAAVVAALPGLGLKTAGETGGLAVEPSHGAPAAKRFSKNRPYIGQVSTLEGLCSITEADDKDTVWVEVDLGDSGMEYQPGDALGILPHNRPEDVAELLGLLGVAGEAEVSEPSWHYEEEGGRSKGGRMPISEALTKCYDLRSPKPELLQLLLSAMPTNGHSTATANGKENGFVPEVANGHGRANGHVHQNGLTHNGTAKTDQAAQLRKLVEGADADAREAYLSQRHVADLIREFAASKPPPLDKVLATLRPLQPRLYSISSSPLERPAAVQATVAVVRYAGQAGRPRVGVASTYLAERLQVGSRVAVYMSKNPDFRLPPDPATPIIMVGPGTGLAPFRAFLQHRILQAEAGAGPAAGPALLFFGCRRSDQDYLYGPQLEAWAAAGHLTLFTAFSREQAEKVYVQDRLRENGALVWDLLQRGGHFYVCGDAQYMAPAVEAALLDVIAEHQGGVAKDGEAYLDMLRAADRYQRDVWF